MPSAASRARNAALVNAVPLSEPSVSDPVLTPRGECSVDDCSRFGGAAADVERPCGDLAGAAVDRGVQVAPAVLATQIEVMSRCQSS
jgi:hypothetical protein